MSPELEKKLIEHAKELGKERTDLMNKKVENYDSIEQEMTINQMKFEGLKKFTSPLK